MSAVGKLKFVCLMLLLVTASARAQPALYFVYTDHLNTPRLVENQSGQTVWRWDQQEPFGNNAADENPSGLGTFELPLRLPGQRYDAETGLHFNYYRDYDPSVGRYSESDPIGLKGGLDTYGYVNGQPVRYVDPTGQQAVLLVCAVGAVALGVGFAAGYIGPDVALALADFAGKGKAVGDLSGNRSDLANECSTGKQEACNAATDAQQQIVPVTGNAVSSGADLVNKIQQQRFSAMSKGASYPASVAPAGNPPRHPNFPSNNRPGAGPYDPGYGR